MRFIRLILASAMLLAASPVKTEDAYPSRQVTVIVPFSAGGTADIFARMVANHLQAKLGKPFVVENVSGAGSIVGVTRLARAAPDGLTLGLASTSALAINPSLYGPKLSYQPDKDLQPIAQISVVPNVLVVNPDKIAARTMPDLIAYLKANPDKVSFGSAGVGTSQHLAAELFQQMTGTKMVHVPYKGSSPMLTDLLSGQIDLAFDNVPLLLPHARTGKLALIATATPKRASFDPDLPAVAEHLPGFEAVAWHGFFVPAATPKPIVEKLSTEIRAFMQQPETVQKMAELGAVAVALEPAAFAAYIASETARWKKVIEAANIKMD
ncbi:tripartite tricarboxylate transporter substrate binding protein [Bradyrhizobium sp. 170]|uniref:Bug family tripartite tricarboxylate transporter substrate binding protein n=1 Tax=Bradyrhizobium sp. 170 TaxID=2782641 RepID=UPI001FFF40DE|nr:tripartite tricarboxylate transporter substrate binding protein [Bradyrhizobium sp. 170]UPK07404.1 tripartite tricarboxylate transporter substrate binding protein [Bradyrhizobium sp. 170]